MSYIYIPDISLHFPMGQLLSGLQYSTLHAVRRDFTLYRVYQLEIFVLYYVLYFPQYCLLLNGFPNDDRWKEDVKKF